MPTWRRSRSQANHGRRFIPLPSVCSSLLLIICQGFSPPTPSANRHCHASIGKLANGLADQSRDGWRPTAGKITSTALVASFAIDGTNASEPLSSWMPYERVKAAAENLRISAQEFEDRYAEVEAYTSCDDDADGLHACGKFWDFLHPTKWIRLRDDAREELRLVMGSSGGTIMSEDEAWLRPYSMIKGADRVAADTMHWCDELKLRTDNDVRVKVVPSWFGLEGFEDAVRDAASELRRVTDTASSEVLSNRPGIASSESNSNAVTVVVCALDRGRNNDDAKSLEEFEKERFTEFAFDLREQIMENESGHDAIAITPFHPLLYSAPTDENGGCPQAGSGGPNMAPYPAAALSLVTASATAVLEACHQTPTVAM